VFLDQATNTSSGCAPARSSGLGAARRERGEATLVKAAISATLMLPEPGNIGLRLRLPAAHPASAERRAEL